VVIERAQEKAGKKRNYKSVADFFKKHKRNSRKNRHRKNRKHTPSRASCEHADQKRDK